MENKRCFLCGRKMLNDVQCSNTKCSRSKLPKELQAKIDRQESEADSDESEDKAVHE